MFVADLLVALIVGVVVTLLFAGLFSAGGSAWPWGSLLLFFVIVMLAAWAGGLWLTPFGPTVFGTTWVPAVLVGLFFALLLAAAAASLGTPVYRGDVIEPETVESQEAGARGVSLFLWILVLFLILAVLAGYL